MYTVVSKKQLSELVYQMDILAPHVCQNAEPGQFVIVVVESGGERIPLTIANIDKATNELTLIFQAVGYSTRKMAEISVGESIPELLGPLGEAAPINGYKNVLVIGGGVGIAPLYPQAKALKASGARVETILGGRSADLIILKEAFTALSDQMHYATNDGSIGVQGFVTDVLEARLSTGTEYDLVIAIGPLVMMKAVCDMTKQYGIKTNVSLNPIMIDGTGMCGGCRVTVGGKTKFACVHGPDFDGHEVDFNEAIRRQSIYKREEHHMCRMTEGVA